MSLNVVILADVRLAADPEVRYTTGEKPLAIARYRAAAERVGVKEGEKDVDFIPCVSFGRTAEFIEKYLRKGSKISLQGSLATSDYVNKDGQKVFKMEVVADVVRFAESKAESEARQGGNRPAPSTGAGDGFMNIPDGIDEELPFMS